MEVTKNSSRADFQDYPNGFESLPADHRELASGAVGQSYWIVAIPARSPADPVPLHKFAPPLYLEQWNKSIPFATLVAIPHTKTHTDVQHSELALTNVI